MTPLVTILIPTYNRARFLREAIQSAVNQTYPELEIIILDDASPDKTSSVAALFLDNPRVHYICNSTNLGISGNWRAGIKNARGEFFCLLHDDDTFEPTFIEKLIQPLKGDPALILSFCDHWIMDAQGNRDVKATEDVSKLFGRNTIHQGVLIDFPQSALIRHSLPVGATLFRKSQISPNFIADQAKGAIDAWLFYQCVRTGSTAYYLADRLMNYRTHSGGMSANLPLYMAEGHLFRHKSILADSRFSRFHPQIKQQMAETLTAYGIALLIMGRRVEARHALKKSMQIDVSFRVAAAYALACGGNVGTRIAATLRH